MSLPEVIGRWNNTKAAGSTEPVRWIWEGIIAERGITLLTAPWKSGKSTLVSMLLDRRRQGGLLLDRSVISGVTVVCSEEDEAHWNRRQQRLDFGPHVCFAKPVGSSPSRERWRRFLDHLHQLAAKNEGTDQAFDLLIIDPISMFLPAQENHPAGLRAVLEELREVARWLPGVLLLHHPRRGAGGRDTARGSGALPALADILFDMRVPGGDPSTRRRLLHGIGRYPEVPARLLIEMNPEATDYAVLADADDDAAFAPSLETIRTLLHQAGTPLTRQEILDRWPTPATRPTAHTLWRWLKRGCDLGALVRHGDGIRGDAHRYGLAAEEPKEGAA